MVDVDSLPQDIRLYSQETLAQSSLEALGSDAIDSDVEDSSGQREDLLSALKKAHGSKAIAAQILGIDRTTLWRRMQKLGIAA